MKNFRIDYSLFTKEIKEKNVFKKCYFINANPGIKIVLLNRFINELPKLFFPVKIILRFFYSRMAIRYGIDLPLKTKFGNNLRIFHYGNIIINPNTKIGNYVVIMHGVTLGNNMKDNNCPKISDKVFIGTGAKIIGDIFLAEGIKVGANAVVTKSFTKPNISIGGIPAIELKSRSLNE